MRGGRRVRLPFASLWRIDAEDGRGPLYLPLFLTRPELFREAVQKLADEGVLAEGHPLRAAADHLC